MTWVKTIDKKDNKHKMEQRNCAEEEHMNNTCKLNV